MIPINLITREEVKNMEITKKDFDFDFSEVEFEKPEISCEGVTSTGCCKPAPTNS